MDNGGAWTAPGAGTLSGDTEAGTPTGIWDFTTIHLNGVLFANASGVYLGTLMMEASAATPWASSASPYFIPAMSTGVNELKAVPGSPVKWHTYVADGVNWDPCSLSGVTPYSVQYDGTDYVCTMDGDGTLLVSSIYFPEADGTFKHVDAASSRSGISPYNNPVSGITLTGANLNSDMIIQSDTYIGLPTAAIVGGVSRWFQKFTIGAGGGALEVGTYSVGTSEPVMGTAAGTWFTATTGFIIPAGNQGATVTIRSGDTTYVFAEGSSAVSPFK